MLIASDIFFELKSSTLVSDLWLNAIYIILNFYLTILLYGYATSHYNILSQMGLYIESRICMKR